MKYSLHSLIIFILALFLISASGLEAKKITKADKKECKQIAGQTYKKARYQCKQTEITELKDKIKQVGAKKRYRDCIKKAKNRRKEQLSQCVKQKQQQTPPKKSSEGC